MAAKEGEVVKAKTLEDRLKIWGVVRYTADLCRGFSGGPKRFEELRPKDQVFRLFAIVWPCAKSPEGSREFASLCVLALLRALLLQFSTDAWGRISQAAYRGDSQKFKQLLRFGVVLTCCSSAYKTLVKYFEERLQVVFRQKIVRKIHDGYYTRMNFYHLPNMPGKQRIVDPEERLCRESSEVARRLSTIVSLTTQALPTLFLFALKTYRVAGLHYALLPDIYHCIAYELTQRYFPKDIGKLYKEKALEEGGYRRQCAHVQRHCEAISALGGAAIEHHILESKFSRVHDVLRRVQWSKLKFDFIFKIAYTHGFRPIIFVFVYLSPWLAGGAVGQAAPARDAATRMSQQMSDVRRISHVMIEMLVANGKLMTCYATALHVQGVCYRIVDFITKLDGLEDSQAEATETTFIESNQIEFRDVQVLTPNKVQLVKDLSFSLPTGTSLLLTGHNGAGKSSIFRCLGGLWSVPSGTISKPGVPGTTGLHGTIFYLPQKPYNVFGTLRDQLTYPRDSEEGGISDDRVGELLRSVSLGHLLDVGLGEVRNWEETLSLGEQQRLAMARLFYHRPQYVVLDECTSAVDSAVESLLYSSCSQMGITYITISHRPALKAFHDAQLNLTGDGQGGWEWKSIDREAEMQIWKRSRAEQVASMEADGKNAPVPAAPFRTAQAEARQPPVASVSQTLRLAKVMVAGSQRRILGLLGLTMLRTALFDVNATLNSRLASLMVQGLPSRVLLISIAFALQDMLTAFVETGMEWSQNEISVSWHARLQAHVTNLWLDKRRFFTLSQLDGRIKDADQVLSDEMTDLAQQFSNIWGSLAKPLTEIVWFSWQLFRMLGGAGAAQLTAYNVLVWVVLRSCMPDHTSLAKREKETESLYRFVQGRLQDHAESIAFFGGGQRERRIADAAFEDIVQASSAQKTAEAKYRFLNGALARDPDDHSRMVSTPMLVQAWLMLRFTKLGSRSTVGGLASGATYMDLATDYIVNGFARLSTLLEDVSKLGATAARITTLVATMEELDAAAGASHGESPDGAVSLESVDIVTPKGQLLARDMSFDLPRGKSMMVTGPNSSGKTSLFRALAGLWPLASGGKIQRPKGIMLVPQRVYSVTGTLIDQVTYPEQHRPWSAEVEARAKEACAAVGLADIVEREGWGKEEKWQDVLSLGEQQRIGIARLFFHRPAIGILDECTSAVSVDAEERMLQGLHQAGIACITMSQRLALEQFHDYELRLGLPTAKAWRFAPIVPFSGPEG